jgi:hypothetical protein
MKTKIRIWLAAIMLLILTEQTPAEIASTEAGTNAANTALSLDSVANPYMMLCTHNRNNIEYLYQGAIWIGGIVGNDTLVSVGADGWQWGGELYPCADPQCGIERRSRDPDDSDYHPDAKSDLEFIAYYSDTLTGELWTQPDWYTGMPHTPLGIEIHQVSYSWETIHAEDFVILEYNIENIGNNEIREAYVGIFVDGDVGDTVNNNAYIDDISGFRREALSPVGNELTEQINLAWTADNDGDPISGSYGYEFDYTSATSLTGIRVLRTPEQGNSISFNWWVPGTFGFPGSEPLPGFVGIPEGDRYKYLYMSIAETNFDQIFACDHWGPFAPPPGLCESIAEGADTRYLVSAGPFDLSPGESKPFTIAFIGGERFHYDPDNFQRNMIDDCNPCEFYNNLSFDDIGLNAIIAGRVYDNPGVDTDGDGYAGEYWTLTDSIGDREFKRKYYYSGDGIPDIRANVPPMSPRLRVSTDLSSVLLRWNGLECETTIDPVLAQTDFEGYRVYMGNSPEVERLALVADYDKANYIVYLVDDISLSLSSFGPPITLATLKEIFGPDCDPDDCPCNDQSDGFIFDGKKYCFDPIGWNQSVVGWADGAVIIHPTRIRKRYANEIMDSIVTSEIDSSNSELWDIEIDDETGDSVWYHRFYEYEFSMNNLNPSIPVYFAVTTVDHGDCGFNIEPIESDPRESLTEIWLSAIKDAAQTGQNIRVYPNPYIEGSSDPKYSVHEAIGGRIYFANIPPNCTIRIYTISGDHVIDLYHPGRFSVSDATVYWNLDSKEDIPVASGIYLFALESDWGNKIGKLVIIK